MFIPNVFTLLHLPWDAGLERFRVDTRDLTASFTEMGAMLRSFNCLLEPCLLLEVCKHWTKHLKA